MFGNNLPFMSTHFYPKKIQAAPRCKSWIINKLFSLSIKRSECCGILIIRKKKDSMVKEIKVKEYRNINV